MQTKTANNSNAIVYKPNDMVDGRYRIIRQTGKGGMNSVVYLAEDTKIDETKVFSLNKNVAIKVINKNSSISDDEWSKFLDECFTNSRVTNKTNIVKTYAILKENNGNSIIIIMEYVDGISLREHISQNGCLSVQESIYYFSKILEGVNQLHSFKKKIIHRDLKPENILLSKDMRQVKIIDFGISSVFEIDDLDGNKKIYTNEKTIYGTYPYICPDIFNIFTSKNERQKTSAITEQFDFYSLGVIFYEMLIGEKPFYAENYDDVNVIKLPLTYDFQVMGNINPNVPTALENIIFRCLASKPEDIKFRYKSINQIINDLKNYEDKPEAFINVKLIKPKSERSFQAKTAFNIQKQQYKEHFYEKHWFYWLIFACCITTLMTTIILKFSFNN